MKSHNSSFSVVVICICIRLLLRIIGILRLRWSSSSPLGSWWPGGSSQVTPGVLCFVRPVCLNASTCLPCQSSTASIGSRMGGLGGPTAPTSLAVCNSDEQLDIAPSWSVSTTALPDRSDTVDFVVRCPNSRKGRDNLLLPFPGRGEGEAPRLWNEPLLDCRLGGTVVDRGCGDFERNMSRIPWLLLLVVLADVCGICEGGLYTDLRASCVEIAGDGIEV